MREGGGCQKSSSKRGWREGIARRDWWDEGGLVRVGEPFFIYLFKSNFPPIGPRPPLCCSRAVSQAEVVCHEQIRGIKKGARYSTHVKCGFGDKHAKQIAEIRVDKPNYCSVCKPNQPPNQCGVAALHVRANPKERHRMREERSLLTPGLGRCREK